MDELAAKTVSTLGSKSEIDDQQMNENYPMVHFDSARLTSELDHSFMAFEQGIRESC